MQFSFRKTEDIQDHILTVFFILIAFLFMVFRHDGGLQSARKMSILAISYIEQPLSHVRVYRTALQTNEQLGYQNILLQDELNRLRSVREENRVLREMLGFLETTDYDLIPVRVVAKNLTGINNSMTVNHGRIHGVEPGMPLIAPNGLIGQVILTASGHSQIMPLSNQLFRVSGRIQGSRAYGVVSWSPDEVNELVMNYVPQTIHVPEGSVVETSGFSNQFPSGILIGTVLRAEFDKGRDTQRLFIRPYVSLHQAAEAFIVRFHPEPEVEELFLEYEGLFR